MVRIELEVDTLEQLETALALGVDVVLLDNMSLDDLRRAVAMARGGHGGLGPHHARDGRRDRGDRVDQIAVGWLTHSAKVLDIGLDA